MSGPPNAAPQIAPEGTTQPSRGTILLIHGIGCTGSVFDRIRPGLEAAGWSTQAPTLFPEYRVSDNPPGHLSSLSLHDYVTAAAGWARAIIKETGALPVVIGHSMGGLIAQKLAEQGLVRAAVLITPAQPVDCQVVNWKVAFTFANILAVGKAERSYKVWRTGFAWGVLNRVPKARHAEIHAGAVYDSGRVYQDIGKPGTDPHRTCTVDETAIACPILTLGATDDRATVIEAVRKVAAKYARIGGDYREYAKAGHWIVDEPRRIST
nr:alpha/beta fold hydrolase [Hyphomonadaceae bacterium]